MKPCDVVVAYDPDHLSTVSGPRSRVACSNGDEQGCMRLTDRVANSYSQPGDQGCILVRHPDSQHRRAGGVVIENGVFHEFQESLLLEMAPLWKGDFNWHFRIIEFTTLNPFSQRKPRRFVHRDRNVYRVEADHRRQDTLFGFDEAANIE